MPCFKALGVRSFGLLFALAIAATLRVAVAADYPTKAITVIVPFPAGGSTDLTARAIAQEFTATLGKNVAISNTAGGAGSVGTAAIARARNDGYTLGIVPKATLVNQPHLRATPYDLSSFEYICGLVDSAQALAVKPDSQFKNLNEFLDYAKAHPGELTYSTAGPGTVTHVAMEQLLAKTGADVKHVPFQGDAPASTALMGGHVDLYMGMMTVIEQKQLNGIAVFSDERVPSLPDLPTAKEQGVDLIAGWWAGVIAPKGTPATVVAAIDKACADASKSDRFKDVVSKLGSSVHYIGSENFGSFVQAESKASGAVIQKILSSTESSKK